MDQWDLMEFWSGWIQGTVFWDFYSSCWVYYVDILYKDNHVLGWLGTICMHKVQSFLKMSINFSAFWSEESYDWTSEKNIC